MQGTQLREQICVAVAVTKQVRSRGKRTNRHHQVIANISNFRERVPPTDNACAVNYVTAETTRFHNSYSLIEENCLRDMQHGALVQFKNYKIIFHEKIKNNKQGRYLLSPRRKSDWQKYEQVLVVIRNNSCKYHVVCVLILQTIELIRLFLLHQQGNFYGLTHYIICIFYCAAVIFSCLT